MNWWKRLCAWLDDYRAALEEIAELRESVVLAQGAAKMHAEQAHRNRCHAEAWERNARHLRENLLGAEAMLHLSEQRCDEWAHRARELERKLHPSSGDDR